MVKVIALKNKNPESSAPGFLISYIKLNNCSV